MEQDLIVKDIKMKNLWESQELYKSQLIALQKLMQDSNFIKEQYNSARVAKSQV